MKPEYIESHVAKHEYIEGPKAAKNFEHVAKAVFRPIGTVAQVTAQPKKRALAHKFGTDRLRVVPFATSLPLLNVAGVFCQSVWRR